ncbi:hypothetical protein ACN47E_000388 [Coniothyrium glycines]
MSRGFDQPTLSSTSRSNNAGPHEQIQQPSALRIRQGRYEVPASTAGTGESKPQQSITSARKPSNPTALSIPQQSGHFESVSTARNPPAYLQGKNPYGQVLDRVKHPYRDNKSAHASESPPSQPGPIVESGRRPSSVLQSQTQSEGVDDTKQIVTPLHAQPRKSPARELPKPNSVKIARDFFETKAASYRPTLPRPLAEAAVIAPDTGAQRLPVQSKRPPRRRSSHNPSSRQARSLPLQASDLPTQVQQDDSVRSVHDSGQHEVEAPVFAVDPEKLTASDELSSAAEDGPSIPDLCEVIPGCRQTADVSRLVLPDATTPGSEQRAKEEASDFDPKSEASLVVLEKSTRSQQSRTSEETVRRQCPSALLTTEPQEAKLADEHTS